MARGQPSALLQPKAVHEAGPSIFREPEPAAAGSAAREAAGFALGVPVAAPRALESAGPRACRGAGGGGGVARGLPVQAALQDPGGRGFL